MHFSICFNMLYLWKMVVNIYTFFPKIFLQTCRTDPHKSDMPIVYASDAFLNLTGAHNISTILSCLFKKA